MSQSKNRSTYESRLYTAYHALCRAAESAQDCHDLGGEIDLRDMAMHVRVQAEESLKNKPSPSMVRTDQLSIGL